MQAIAALLVVIVIIVTVHEFGHYIVGRLCGIHAEVFSLGFGPLLWSWIDKRGTRWQIAALPLGGYVRFLGDADAASRPGVLSGLSEAEKRHTMQGAPLWARAATVLAGPAFNVALTLLVFFGLILSSGIDNDSTVIGSLRSLPTGKNPLQVGDRVLSLDGTPTPDFETLATQAKALKDRATVTYVIERAGETLMFPGPNPMPALVQSVSLNSAAEDAGLQVGDLFLRVAGKDIAGFDQLTPLVEATQGQLVALTIQRGDQVRDLSLTPRRVDLPDMQGGFTTRWLIGVSGGLMFEPTRRSAGIFEAAQLSVRQSWLMAKTNLNGIAQIVAGKISSCNISGPIGMAKAASAAARSGLDTFLQTLALFSLSIGLLNLLPIPVLDGGHLVFHVWEAMTGRAPNGRALQVLMSLGLALLLTLMVFALSNDLFRCT